MGFIEIPQNNCNNIWDSRRNDYQECSSYNEIEQKNKEYLFGLIQKIHVDGSILHY